MSIDDTNNKKNEFRQDIISGDWILIASKREDYFKKILEKNKKENIKKTEKEIIESLKSCPFENPQKNGNENPILMLDENGKKISENNLSAEKNWFLQIIPNKNPSVEIHYKTCPQKEYYGPFGKISAIGFSEIVITRGHEKHLALMDTKEIETVIAAYKERYLELSKEPCLKYILIFHNHGKEAGASVSHPHSQIIALPIIPPDVNKSLNGCYTYFENQKKCAHCESLKWELENKERIIYENSDFAALCPYASRANFEIRIFPKKHSPNFEKITDAEKENLSIAFKDIFSRIYKKLKNPSYNFFIHTSPLSYSSDYHWHIEILPRMSTWGGFEFGAGIEIVAVSPEKAAEILK